MLCESLVEVICRLLRIKRVIYLVFLIRCLKKVEIVEVMVLEVWLWVKAGGYFYSKKVVFHNKK